MKKSLNQTAEQLIAPPAAANQDVQKPVELEEDVEQEEYNEDEYRFLKNALPKGVSIEDAMSYGFYEHKNRYWIRRKEDRFEPVSNFTLTVKYLIVGAHPKRIVEIKNVHRRKAVLDFEIEDMISLDRFKAKVESQGNFLFEGKGPDLARIKNKLFEYEKAAVEISRLGQYRNQFFTWANGIFTGNEFKAIDNSGMVDINGDHYYIPVFGGTTSDDDDDLRNYRRFMHRESAVTFQEWSKLFVEVYGDNGKLGIAFFFFSLFSDIIFERTKASPMLFLFGQRGSGKGTMANSLMMLYGHAQDPLMLGGASTVVGFMRKLGQFSNAMVWLDEYKNDIGERKIESLKNIWDRVGYERGVKDSSNKTQTTPVTSSAIISGQEIPNVEPALFSRCVLCEFKTMQRSQVEVDNFNALRRMEDGGITNVTLETLKHRELIREKFFKAYAEISASLRQAFGDQDVIERQIINYSILASTVMVLEEKVKLPFTSSELLQISERFIERQRDMMKQSNEVQQFFEMVQFLLQGGLISPEKDILISKGHVKIRMVSIIGLYREHARKQGLRVIDRGTLMNYIQNSDAFCKDESKQASHRFPGLQNPTSAVVFLHSEIKRLYGVDITENLQDVDNQSDNTKPPY
jgi:hypothetical protein